MIDLPHATEDFKRRNPHLFAPVQVVPAGGCEDESELHEQIAGECKKRGWLAIHSRMDKPTTYQRGTWDFIILQQKGKTLLIEAKSKKNKPTDVQQGMHRWAEKLEHRTHVVWNLAEFLNIINMNDNLPPGCTDADCEGAQERAEDGLTRADRNEIDKAEHKADCEREEKP